MALQPRWDGIGAPPVHRAPPLAGNVVLETTHPFHFKLCPAIMLGPKCNHDVGVLLRLPVLTPQQLQCDAALLRAELFPETRSLSEDASAPGVGQGSLDGEMLAAIAAGVETLLETIVDHEFYCVTYATKDLLGDSTLQIAHSMSFLPVASMRF